MQILRLRTPFIVVAVAACDILGGPRARAQSVVAADELRARALFNGHDLTGWEGSDNWTVDRGEILGKTSDHGRRALSYRAARIPQSFELDFEWRLPMAERTAEKPANIPPGLFSFAFNFVPVTEVAGGQRRVSKNGTLAFGFGLGTGWLKIATDEVPLPQDWDSRNASFSDELLKDAARPAGQWNRGRIVWIGDTIQHWVNGAKVSETNLTKTLESKENAQLREVTARLRKHEFFLRLEDDDGGIRFRNLSLKDTSK